MDALILQNYLLLKRKQPTHKNDDSWKNQFELD